MNRKKNQNTAVLRDMINLDYVVITIYKVDSSQIIIQVFVRRNEESGK